MKINNWKGIFAESKGADGPMESQFLLPIYLFNRGKCDI